MIIDRSNQLFRQNTKLVFTAGQHKYILKVSPLKCVNLTCMYIISHIKSSTIFHLYLRSNACVYIQYIYLLYIIV